jgi:hypothetical protein
MELFSIKFMRWDVFVGWNQEPLRDKPTGIFGDRYDRELWVRGRLNIVISNLKLDRKPQGTASA